MALRLPQLPSASQGTSPHGYGSSGGASPSSRSRGHRRGDVAPVSRTNCEPELTRPRLLLRSSGHLRAVAFVPQLKMIITGDTSKQLVAWSLTIGERCWGQKCLDDVRCITYAHPLRSVISGDEGNKVTCWDVITGVKRRELSCDSIVMSVVVSLELNALLSASNGGEVVMWDTCTWEKRSVIQCEDHLLGMAYAPDLRAIVSADGLYFKASVWDLESGALRQEVHCDDWVLSVAYVAGLRAIVSGDETMKLIVWDAETGVSLWTLTLNSSVNSVAFAPDICALIANDHDDVVIQDAKTGTLLQRFPTVHKEASKDGLCIVVYDATTGEVATGDAKGCLAVWPVSKTSMRAPVLPTECVRRNGSVPLSRSVRDDHATRHEVQKG